jgi:hypothetical protein
MADFYIDINPAIDQIRREFYDVSNPRSNAKINLAIARAINHTLAKAKTAASREIRQEYNVKAKELKAGLSINKTSRTFTEGMLIATGRPLPLIAFGARQNFTYVRGAHGSRKLKGGGVSVDVMGQRKIIKGAFIATMDSGHTGVFARGKYSGNGFDFREKRLVKKGNDLAINELTTSSVPKMMQNNAVIKNLTLLLERDFPARLQHEASRLLSRRD